MKKLHTQTLPIPGTQDSLTYERDDSGRLVRLSCNGRVYLHERDGRRVFGDELAAVSEVATTSSLLRHVRAAGKSWTEKYLWDAKGQIVHIDGVEMRYDDRKRITACLGSHGNGHGNWFYAYAGDDLVTIDGPFGVRHLARGADGRPVRVREGNSIYDIAYDADGRRRDVPPTPENWHRDALGRLWTVADSDGRIMTTYLWDGFACLGRINGPPGEPLATVFSLDPSLTPVRMITSQNLTRVPRDAFGEGLLSHTGVPGLYGGTVHGDYVYLPARALDPRTGAFDTPEPWHGLENDPRRAEGYRGPLTVEKAPAGPYAVCQNDPVGRTDPIGAISADAASGLMWAADFTWALQNNLMGWLGMDGWLNLFGSLFTCNMDRFGSSERFESVRKGTSGVRRDGAVGGIVEPRAFTFQHIVWSGSGHIDELDDIRVFVPNEAYRPTLYGSLLLLEPEDNTPLILQGTKHVGGANGWTRAGGTAEPVIPGSPVPHFPAGGINFDGGYWDEYGSYHRGVIRRGMRGPRDATMTELEVMDRLGTGILDAKATLADCLVATVNATGLGLAEGDFVRMTDGSGTSAISAVLKEVEEKASTTLIHVETNAADLDIATGVELHVLGAPVSTEYLNPVSSDGISTAGSTEAYGVGDLLRLTQSPSAKGLALIAHLEMCVEVGETLIGLGMALPLTIALANQGGMPRRVTIPIVQEVDFTLTINDATAAGALIPSLPGVGDAITLTDQNGLTLAVVVTAINSDPSGNVRDVDRDLSGLDTNGDILWQPLTRDADDLGPWGYSINPDRVVQYEPPDIRTTPPAGFLWIEDSSTPDAIIAVREITGFRYDAFILDTPLPGTVTDLYTVQRLAGQDGPYDVNTIEESQALLFNSPASINRFTAVVEATGLDLDEGDFVLLMDGGGHRGISEVLSAAEVNGETRVGVGSCAAVMGTNIRLQVLDAPASAEALNSAPNKDDAFDVANATGLYTIGNVLRLVQGTTMEKAVLIEGLEARVEVDEAFPAGMQPPFTIAHALQMGQRQTVNAVALPQTVDFTGTNNIPSVDDAITLTDQAGLILAVIVTAIDPADPNGNTLIVDRDLSSLDTANPVSWRPLVRSRELGSWGDAPPIDAFMTYTPPAVHKAPTAGFLLVEDANTPPQAVVREIKNIDYDAIVTDVPLPGDIAQPYDVLCFVPQQSAKPVRTIDYERELIFDSPLDTDDAAVMQVQWLTDPTLNGAAFSDQLSDPAVVGSPVVSIVGGSPVAMLSFNPLPNPTPDWQHKDWPRPSQVVLLVPTGGGDREAALVKQLRMTFTFDRQLTVSNEGLKLIPLEEGSPRYKARQLGPLVIEFETEQPFLTPVAVGDSLDVDWGGSENQFRVADVEGTGTTLTLEGGAEQPVSVNITGETDIVQAHVVAQPTVIVDPLVDVGGNPCRAQMPRFGIDEIVQGNWAAGTQAVLVTKVNGRQITVVNPNAPVIDNTDPNTPILDETNTATPVTDGLTICRLVPSDPDTGGSRAGVAGEPIGGTPDGENRTATNCIQFQIWHPKPLNSSLQAVILDGNTVLPANVDSAVPLNLEIVFADPPKIAAEGDVTANILKPEIAATCYATHLIPGSNDSVIMSNFWPDESTALADNASHMAIAIPFRKMTDPERTVKGVLQAGTTRIPADPDGEELTRRQSLIEHELIHTRQFIQWGQMMLSPFPLWLLELCFEGGTSVEEYPHFSDWTNATLEVHNSRRTIQIDSPPVTFADDDCVQVFHGQTPTIGELKEPVEGEQNKFFIDIDSDVPNGAILVRRCEPSGGDLTAEVFLNILQPLSVGGVLNTLVGSTYAALLWLLGKGLYACIPNLESATPATVEADEEGNKKILRLANEKGRDILRGATRVIVQSGGSTIVRVVDTIDGDVVKLKSAVDFEGQVNVSPYATHAHGNVFDWYSYYPAQVPDSNQPSTIRLFDVNGKSLTLAIHDRVTIARPEDKWYSWGFRTTVIAVNADGTIDLKDPPPTSGEARDLRIAKVAEEDPLGWVDGWIMNEFGMGWLRFFFDPYGHIHFRASPEPGSGWDIPLRIVRYMFGTRSWSPVMLGSLLWFNLAYQPNNGHLAEMEQEAAQESGDLYSPIGRLEGTLDVVGDVARYWYFLNNRNGSLILADHQDAPGVHIQDGMRLMPFVTGEVNDHAPNNGATAGPTEPGTAVPDAFVRKDPANPMNVTPGLTYPTQCFAPTVRGWIPTSTVLHRASGIYVAFTRPGKHRITLRDNDLTVSPEIIHTLTAEEGRAAQDANSYLPPYGTLQTLFFEREVADVFVWIAGRVVNSPALGNPVPTVKLVQTQRAVVNVEPTEGRQYTVMLTSPDTGGVLRAESDLVFVAQTQNASESIDIARVHRCNDDGVYSSEDLSKHGVHLPEDLYITVRQVEIEVVDTLTVREAIPSMGDLLGDLALDVGENNELRPGGEVRYILVPASGAAPVRLGDLDYGLAPAQMPTPVPTNPAPTSIPKQVPDNLKPFLGSDGAIFEITLAADDPPEEEVEATLEIDVGPTNNRGTLVAKVTLVPHCRLVLPGGGVNYQITPVVGVDTVVVLRCEDDGGAAVNVRLVSVTPAGVADVTVETDDTENVTITIGENAPKDFYQILVEDIANPDHMARRTFEVI